MTDDRCHVGDSAGSVARLSGVLISRETVATSLVLVSSLAREAIVGSTGAGVTLIDGGRRLTAAASDAVVERADGLVHELERHLLRQLIDDSEHPAGAGHQPALDLG